VGRYDRITKRVIYAEAGVIEYWILDPAGRCEKWHGPSLSEIELVAEQVTSPLLEGHRLEVGRLFG
jgi:Uma2 family endonuclease